MTEAIHMLLTDADARSAEAVETTLQENFSVTAFWFD